MSHKHPQRRCPCGNNMRYLSFGCYICTKCGEWFEPSKGMGRQARDRNPEWVLYEPLLVSGPYPRMVWSGQWW